MDWNWVCDTKIGSKVDTGVDLIRKLISHFEENQWSPNDIFGIHMAMEEAVMNAIKHGNQRDESKNVHVIVKTTRDQLYIKVTDEGDGFDPNAVPDCTLEENLEKTSGRGLMLMNNYMDWVQYNEKGNSVEMTKSRGDES